MDQLLKAIILGVVEGVTEFLPVSSTGHLILMNQFIGFEARFTKMFDVVIQLGAIIAVIVYFKERLFPWTPGKSAAERKHIWRVWRKTWIGVLPALAIGAAFHHIIETVLFNPVVVGLALIGGGIALIHLEQGISKRTISSLDDLSDKTALQIGLIQCLAMIPGVSRSAATIIGGMMLGTSRVVAAEYSFFLAIPTMIAASGYSFVKMGFNLTIGETVVLITGFITAFLTAWLVIASFMRYIQHHRFKIFGYYRIGLGVAVLIYFGWLHQLFGP